MLPLPCAPIAVALLAATPLTAPAQSSLDVPGQYATIQAAIDTASGGDTVLVQPGTYSERIDFRGKALELRSAGGAADTIIDGAGAVGSWTDGPDAVVRFDEGEGPASILSGFTVTGSDSLVTSHAVWAIGATPTLEGCILRDNVSALGGGFSGGGSLIDCQVQGNVGGSGGGVRGTADLTGCLIAGNLSQYDPGGGVLATGPCTIVDCRILDNQTSGDAYSGGGVAGPAHLAYCLVAGNSIRPFGGVGINGAGLFEPASVDHCTIVANFIDGLPCAPFCDAGGVYGGGPITNSIVRGNLPNQLVAAGAVSWSDVEGGSLGPGNFDADPLFVDAAGGDYQLALDSPCIDAGDPNAPIEPDGTRTDVGAFPRLGALQSEVFAISVSSGGTQPIHIDAGIACANNVYILAGSASGTAPGLPLPKGLVIPLVVDSYFNLTLAGGAASPLLNHVGVMNSLGQAEASFVVPPATAPALIGLHLDHAGLGLDDLLAPAVTSNPLPVDLVP